MTDRYYTFEPKEDITAYEVALILRNALLRPIEAQYIEILLPEHLRKHFALHKRAKTPPWWVRLWRA